MNALTNNIQNTVTTTNHESMNLKEESQMKTTNNTSKWNFISTPVKMIAGLAVGAIMMTAVAMPSNVSADVPGKTFTSEFELMIQAEVDDSAYVPANLTAEQELVVMAEIDDGAYLPGYVSAEQQLLTQAEIEDGFALEVSTKESTGTPSVGEHLVMIQAEIEDGSVGYSSNQTGRSSSGNSASVMQALLSDDGGSVFSGEHWLVIQAEVEDHSV